MSLEGTYDTIDLRQCVTGAKFQLFGPTEGSDNDLWFATLANEAVRHTDCLSIFKKHVCVICVEDKKAKLPAGFNRMLAVRYNTTDSTSGYFLYIDEPFLTNCGANTEQWLGWYPMQGSFEIQDGYLYIHQNPTVTTLNEDTGQLETVELEITELTIAYMGLNVDDSGLMKVYSDMERGIVSFICYRYCLQNMDIPKYAAQMNIHRETWQAQKKWLKGISFQDNFRNTRRQVMQWANALVVDKNAWGI